MNAHIGDQIKVVFFDFDDTLVGTIEAAWAHHKYVAATHYQKELTDAELAEHWGKPFSEILSLLYGPDNLSEALAFSNASRKNYPKKIFTASLPTLDHLKQSGKRIGIITSTLRHYLEHDLALHGINPELFDYLQTEEDTQFHKPDPRAFQPALEWLTSQNLQAQEVLYVGDGLHDMKAAVGAGFNFIGVETGLVSAEEFTQHGSKSVKDIGELVEELEGPVVEPVEVVRPVVEELLVGKGLPVVLLEELVEGKGEPVEVEEDVIVGVGEEPVEVLLEEELEGKGEAPVEVAEELVEVNNEGLGVAELRGEAEGKGEPEEVLEVPVLVESVGHSPATGAEPKFCTGPDGP